MQNRKLKSLLMLLMSLFLCICLPVNAEPGATQTSKAQQRRLEVIVNKVRFHSEVTRGKDYKLIMRLTSEGLKIDPKNKTLLYFKAVAFVDLGRNKPALDTLNHALTFHPKDKDLISLKSKVIRIIDELEKQVILDSKSLEKNPFDTKARIDLVNINVNRGDYKDAMSLLNKGLSLNPNSLDLLYRQALLYSDLEQFKSARENIKKMLLVDSGNDEAEDLLEKLAKYPDVNKKQNEALAPGDKMPGFTKQKPKEKKVHTAKKKKKYDKVYDLIDQRRHKEALAIVESKLKQDPTNFELLYKKALIYYEMGRFPQAMMALDDLFDIDRDNAKGLALLKTLERTDPHHFRGLNLLELYTYPAYVSDLHSWWTYSTLSYGRVTPIGPFYLQVNNATRFGDIGYQYQASFYPKINDYIYLYLSYAYSNEDTGSQLWPYDRGDAEAYFQLPWEVEVSAGGKFFNILGTTHFWASTVSFSKFCGKYWLRIRPYLYIPGEGARGVYVTADFRRYFSNDETWLGVTFGTGNIPDLADLTSIGFFMIHSTGFLVQAQFPLKYGIFMRLGAGYTMEEFPSGLHRKKTVFGVALKYRF